MIVQIGNTYRERVNKGRIVEVTAINDDNITFKFTKSEYKGNFIFHIDEFNKGFYDPSTPIKEDIKMNLAINDTYQNKYTDKIVKIKEISGGTVTYIFTEVDSPAGEFKESEDGFKNIYVHYADSDSMPIIRGNTYKNKESGLLVEVTKLNDKVRFKFIEGKLASNKFSLTFKEFRRCYMDYPTGPAPVDQRKECFACKEPIELGCEKEYKSAYYHNDCLINSKKNNAFLADNEPVDISDLQPDKIIINEPVDISDLNFKIDKLNLELTKAHQLIGKLTLKLEQYK